MKLLADRGGVDYKNTNRTLYAAPVAAGATALNVTGSGWIFLVTAWLNSTGSATSYVDITVDGILLEKVVVCKGVESSGGNNRAAGGTYAIPIRFESSMVVTCSGLTYLCVIYGLDTGSGKLYGTKNIPDPYKLKPNYGTFNQNYQTTTYFDVLNISGSGYLLGMHGAAGDDDGVTVWVNLFIDGVQIWNGLNLMNGDDAASRELHITTPIRFNSSLQIQTKSSGATAGATLNTKYTLD